MIKAQSPRAFSVQIYTSYKSLICIEGLLNLKQKTFLKTFRREIISIIDQTPFVCKVTLQNGMAAFDLPIGNNLICTSLCCFVRKDRETIITYAKELGRSVLRKEFSLQTPRKDLFIYTLVVNPSAPSEYLQLAAEIELYIYNAISTG